ncbi:hydroxyacylglutathione hydrolase [Thorsellia anophelis]|uniref:Hydroxyacylglutathione hydrolase n=1 Tax=Thorsellia anophelis DSM 18579 TaxID=1123402 RepID=A0A1H9YD96_9GAMM|nr:hydroxyacylglutathione hydrolase [Thorsellia anophelis]SES66968.1 hydroxyacylglutathione hydrolase [Thorsellia anophelis DSM 18579]
MTTLTLSDLNVSYINDWQLTALPVLTDNYIWLLTKMSSSDKETIIVDPGVSEPVINYLNHHQLTPTAIILTHHHYDHTDGVEALVEHYKGLLVYGPEETRHKGANQIIKDQDQITLLGKPCNIIETPGHTLGHVCYYFGEILFTGDTLFSAGCGRLFEGSYQQMFDSLNKLMEFPASTLVCPAHEYTLSNLKFAASIFKHNQEIKSHIQLIESRYHSKQPSVPSSIEIEQRINPYLLCKYIDLNEIPVKTYNYFDTLQRFSELRKLKDNF